MKELYVVNCCRTAVGSFGGSLKNTPAAQLGSIVVKEALKRANVAPENVDELMFTRYGNKKQQLCLAVPPRPRAQKRDVSFEASLLISSFYETEIT